MKKKKIAPAASELPSQEDYRLSTLTKARIRPKRQTEKAKQPPDDSWEKITGTKKVSKGADEEME